MSDSIQTLHVGEKVNFHTHSWYCGHATGELTDYVEAAKTCGLTALGFSEHCPVPDNRWKDSRMWFNQKESYMQECRSLQLQHTDLDIICGFECDHDPRYVSYYTDELINTGFVDYLIFGIHHLNNSDGSTTDLQTLPTSVSRLHAYTDQYLAGLTSGHYLFAVHPDLFGFFYRRWDDEAISCSRAILSCAESEGIPLEINGYGYRKQKRESAEGMRRPYPLPQFWELATQYNISIIVNSDAHRPEHMDIRGLGVAELADELQLKRAQWLITRDEKGYKKPILVR